MSIPSEFANQAARQHQHHLEHALRTLKGVHEASGRPWAEVSVRNQVLAPWPILACDDICVRNEALWRVETSFNEGQGALETRVRELR